MAQWSLPSTTGGRDVGRQAWRWAGRGGAGVCHHHDGLAEPGPLPRPRLYTCKEHSTCGEGGARRHQPAAGAPRQGRGAQRSQASRCTPPALLNAKFTSQVLTLRLRSASKDIWLTLISAGAKCRWNETGVALAFLDCDPGLRVEVEV